MFGRPSEASQKSLAIGEIRQDTETLTASKIAFFFTFFKRTETIIPEMNWNYPNRFIYQNYNIFAEKTNLNHKIFAIFENFNFW